MVRELYPACVCVLALWGTAAHALGLGGLRQLSALDQPFVGEIELVDASPDELESMKAQIASQAEFARVGSERYHYLTKLRFSPQLSARGNPVIRVTSRDPIREPYMDFLVEALWPTGRLVKQYTLLLDPPVLDGRPPSAPREAPVSDQAQPEPESYQIPATAGYPKRYGPVRSGVGLWRLARANTPRGATVAQTAMALFRNNQDAFANGDIQRLRVGQTLTLPHAGELFALSPAAARREYDAALRGGEVQRSPIAAAPPDSAAPRLRIAGAAEQPAVATKTGPEPREASTEASTEAMEKELLLVRETSESAHQEALEMRGRIRDLEAQLTEIQQLLKLRNEDLARVQGGKGSALVGPPGVLGTPPAPRQVAAPGVPSAGPGAAGPAGAVPTVAAKEGKTGPVLAAVGTTAPTAPGLPPQTSPDQGPQAAPPAPETKPPPVQTAGAGTAPAAGPVSKPPVAPPAADDLVDDSLWLALWLPLAGIVGVTALGIGALAWLRLRRRAEFESTATEPSAGSLPVPIADRGLATLGSRVKEWLGQRRLVGRASSEAFAPGAVPEETGFQPVPESAVTGLVQRVQRWLRSRRPGGPAVGPESEATDLSEEVIPSQTPPEAGGMPPEMRDGAPAPVTEVAGETLAPAPGLLTLPRYRLPTDQVPVATVAVEPPPVAPSAVAADRAPDSEGQPALDDLDLDLDFDLDALGPVDHQDRGLAAMMDLPIEDGLSDETTVKLDLARVYLEMGDRESARDLLDEVIGEGTEAQRAEARELSRRVV